MARSNKNTPASAQPVNVEIEAAAVEIDNVGTAVATRPSAGGAVAPSILFEVMIGRADMTAIYVENYEGAFLEIKDRAVALQTKLSARIERVTKRLAAIEVEDRKNVAESLAFAEEVKEMLETKYPLAKIKASASADAYNTAARTIEVTSTVGISIPGDYNTCELKQSTKRSIPPEAVELLVEGDRAHDLKGQATALAVRAAKETSNDRLQVIERKANAQIGKHILSQTEEGRAFLDGLLGGNIQAASLDRDALRAREDLAKLEKTVDAFLAACEV